MMIAALLGGMLGMFSYAQTPPTPVEPPEEDESLIRPQQYEFNPLQAKKEMSTGDFYAKRGNYKAAAARYREATLWDNGLLEAYFKLGEANEKLKYYDAARDAYSKFASLATDKKKAEEARKRASKLPAGPGAAADSGPKQLDTVPDVDRIPGAYNRTLNTHK
jgi:tetratricopeptide (TPR) repeat protein